MLQEKPRLTATLRVDKNDYFNVKFNPRFTAVYSPTPRQNFRLSYQSGYRFPSLFEGFSNVNSGQVKRVGGLRVMSNGVFENSYLRTSIDCLQRGRDGRHQRYARPNARTQRRCCQPSSRLVQKPVHLPAARVYSFARSGLQSGGRVRRAGCWSTSISTTIPTATSSRRWRHTCPQHHQRRGAGYRATDLKYAGYGAEYYAPSQPAAPPRARPATASGPTRRARCTTTAARPGLRYNLVGGYLAAPTPPTPASTAPRTATASKTASTPRSWPYNLSFGQRKRSYSNVGFGLNYRHQRQLLFPNLPRE
ncbi:MAG: TonB-dependent receptor [Hymenobacter sp.]